MKHKKTTFGPLYDGVTFKAHIDGDPVEGKINVAERRSVIYLCQNNHPGADCYDKKGYNYSWVMADFYKCMNKKYKKDEHICDNVTNLKLGNKMEHILHQVST